ncbi:hypothetical protein [Fimbriiglobus ruber]|uniref:Uncharacterized protein n=1 Tax=Fimbriiglobus ruber TaxID=1908690 RepID=A0A225DI04_9BACT|nr:hypothetical protein [Fimbriiglobus ruber]OWK38198.1 hypothetical protein FRUB_07318 [Fimbriiglobus ruber]
MRTLWLGAAAVLVSLTSAGAGRTADPFMPSTDVDKQAQKVAYAAANLGANLYNAGNHYACYRLYEGSLRALKVYLAHRTELVKIIDAKLEKTETLNTPEEKAFALREGLDAVLKAPVADK